MISNRVAPRSPGLIRAQEIQLKILAELSAAELVEAQKLEAYEYAHQSWAVRVQQARLAGLWLDRAVRFLDHFGIWPGDL